MTMLVRGGAVTGSALPTNATAGQVLSWNGSAWVAATPSATGTTPNATTTVPGLVQLAGDLAGSATAPTVAKINGAAPAPVATSGAYTDLTGRPALAPVATSGAYADLTSRPVLSPVATSGSYGDLIGRPLLAPVATSGAYADLTGAPVAGPAVYAAGKKTDTTTASTTPINDPELVFPAVPAGTYLLSAFLRNTTSGVLQVNIGGTATSTHAWYLGSSTGVAGTAAQTVTYAAIIVGYLIVTAPGSVVLTVASTSTSTATCTAGSSITLTRTA